MKTFLLFFILVAYSGLAQQDSVSFSLSFVDKKQQFGFHPTDTTSLIITVKNHGTIPYDFFHTSCSEGLKAIGFEMLTSDSTYQIKLQDRIVIRNVVMTDELLPGDSLEWEVNLIDSAQLDDIFAKGYVGMPNYFNSQIYLRLRYELRPEDASSIHINRSNYGRDFYIDYLDGDIESSIYYADSTLRNDDDPVVVEKVIPESPNVARRPNPKESGLLMGVFYSEPIPIVYRE